MQRLVSFFVIFAILTVSVSAYFPVCTTPSICQQCAAAVSCSEEQFNTEYACCPSGGGLYCPNGVSSCLCTIAQNCNTFSWPTSSTGSVSSSTGAATVYNYNGCDTLPQYQSSITIGTSYSVISSLGCPSSAPVGNLGYWNVYSDAPFNVLLTNSAGSSIPVNPTSPNTLCITDNTFFMQSLNSITLQARCSSGECNLQFVASMWCTPNPMPSNRTACSSGPDQCAGREVINGNIVSISNSPVLNVRGELCCLDVYEPFFSGNECLCGYHCPTTCGSQYAPARGNCNSFNGQCFCQPMWSGPDCSTPTDYIFTYPSVQVTPVNGPGGFYCNGHAQCCHIQDIQLCSTNTSCTCYSQTYKTGCTNDCSGSGQCGANGECVCPGQVAGQVWASDCSSYTVTGAITGNLYESTIDCPAYIAIRSISIVSNTIGAHVTVMSFPPTMIMTYFPDLSGGGYNGSSSFDWSYYQSYVYPVGNKVVISITCDVTPCNVTFIMDRMCTWSLPSSGAISYTGYETMSFASEILYQGQCTAETCYQPLPAIDSACKIQSNNNLLYVNNSICHNFSSSYFPPSLTNVSQSCNNSCIVSTTPPSYNTASSGTKTTVILLDDVSAWALVLFCLLDVIVLVFY